MDGATDEVREARRARASDSPLPGECTTHEQPGQTEKDCGNYPIESGKNRVTDLCQARLTIRGDSARCLVFTMAVLAQIVTNAVARAVAGAAAGAGPGPDADLPERSEDLR